MRLYRAELYKLCHKKAFLIGSVITALILLVYFLLMISDQMTTVNGVTYHGYDAVRMDRQITEAYRGELTDEKVRGIVEEYGLPSGVKESYGWWQDANYLNRFVTDYLSDGYIRGWDDYQIPAKVYAIADTKLGEVQEAREEAIPLAYAVGWNVLFKTLEISMIPASILVIMGVSVVFAQESQEGMLPLLFTAQEGKEKDARMKIAAAFTLTIIVYCIVVLSTLILCGSVFGLDGADCPLYMAAPDYVWLNTKSASSYMPVQTFMWIVIGFDFLAMMLLCAINLCVSAHCRSNFSAVTIVAALWGAPLLGGMLLGGLGYFIATCMPLYMVMVGTVYESMQWGRTASNIWLGLVVSVVCVSKGYQSYKRQS